MDQQAPGRGVGLDPWDARTIEWMSPTRLPSTTSPSSRGVTSLDHFWHLKYDEDAEGRPSARRTATRCGQHRDQLNPAVTDPSPQPLLLPVLLGAGLPLIFYGIIYHTAALGKALIVVGVMISLPP